MRILINASTSIGDSFYFAFMLDNLYKRFPSASMQLMCWHPMVSFYRSFPYLEQIIPYDKIEKDIKFSMFLLHPKVDLFIDLQHTEESAKLTSAINASYRIGVNPHKDMYEYYNYIIKPEEDEHIFEAFYRGFRELWQEFDLDTAFNIRLSKQQEMQALSILLEANIALDDKYVIVHPGAKGEEKLWNNHSWAVVVDYLHKQDLKVILLGSTLQGWGGAKILDAYNCDEIYHLVPNACVNLVGKVDDFLILAFIIKNALFYCGLDTGPTHLAALLNVPVFELYKYYDDRTLKLWKPYGERVHMLIDKNLNNITAKEFIELIESNAPEYSSIYNI